MAYSKEYYGANRVKIAEQTKAYREAHKEQNKEYQQAYREANKEKIREQKKEYDKFHREINRNRNSDRQKAWYVAGGKEKQRESRFQREYGISVAEYDAMLIAQNNRCQICYVEFGPHWSKTACHVDHSHTTGSVRGLLCNNCNLMLGNYECIIQTGQREQFNAYLSAYQADGT
jgi:hypothetical protein